MTPGKGSVFLVHRARPVSLPRSYDREMIEKVLTEIVVFRVSPHLRTCCILVLFSDWLEPSQTDPCDWAF